MLLPPLLRYLCDAVSEVKRTFTELLIDFITAAMTARKLGGGLIEISAVATVIGAPIAEALMHGLKAAAGLAWGPMSTFGVIHVTKACLAASVPDWLRESLGLRNQHVDMALGVMLDVDRFEQSKHRVDMGDALAIQVVHSREADEAFAAYLKQLLRTTRTGHRQSKKARVATLHQAMTSPQAKSHGQCIYTYDKNTQLVLGSISAAQHGEAVKIHTFIPDFEGTVPSWKDWLFILLSSVKIAETVTLYELGSTRLWISSLFGWSHAFVSAILLQLCGLGRDSALKCDRDLVSGQLPSALNLGESGKIILNVPRNVRRHGLWKAVLTTGVIFNLVGLFATFFFIGAEQQSRVVFVWLGWQVLWLIARSVVYYFVEGAGATRQGLITSKIWEECSTDDRTRVLCLLDELTEHQVANHPRGAHAYTSDCVSYHHLAVLLRECDWRLRTHAEQINVNTGLEVCAVTGDCLIRTSVWFSGLEVESNEIYDSCIAFIASQPDGRISAVSCVRVYTCLCVSQVGRDRGNANHTCGQLEWAYFIPTGDETDCSWIMAHGRSATGRLPAELLSSVELNSRLSIGYWKISLGSLADLQLALQVSQKAGANVLTVLKGEGQRRRQNEHFAKHADVKEIETSAYEV